MLDQQVDDQGTDQQEAQAMLQKLRDQGFDGDNDKLAIALGRSAEQVEAARANLEGRLPAYGGGVELNPVVISGGEVVAAGGLEEIRARAGNARLEDAFVSLMDGGPAPDEAPP